MCMHTADHLWKYALALVYQGVIENEMALSCDFKYPEMFFFYFLKEYQF